MKLLILRDHRHGKPTGKGTGGLPPAVAKALEAVGRRGKHEDEVEPEWLYEFKAGEVHDIPDDLARRLLRDYGEIDYPRWRQMQRRSDQPIITPPRRTNPVFAVVNEQEIVDDEAELAAMDERRRAERSEVVVEV